MITLATTAETNDIYADKSGNIAIISGAEALAQTLSHISQSQRNEMIYATNRGIPYRDTVFQSKDFLLFEAAMRSEFMKHPEVTGIASFVISQDGEDVTYEAQVNSIYGLVRVNG